MFFFFLFFFVLPPKILAALDIVRQGADVMPRNQLNQVLNVELGQEWSSKLISFDYEPMAAASIGQVLHNYTIHFFYGLLTCGVMV